ncbi:MAG: phosphotyrosine protein phosphatase [Pseudomonadota bacterium]
MNRKDQNLLFVCSRNKWRSPTGEKIFSRYPDISTRSVGTSKNARRKITENDIKWADMIFFMEQQHYTKSESLFGKILDGKELFILDISDEYQFREPELVSMLTDVITPVLEDRA